MSYFEPILPAMDKQDATTGPIAIANRIVPNPKVPPRITPMISTETSKVILTLPIGTPVTLCRPVILSLIHI